MEFESDEKIKNDLLNKMNDASSIEELLNLKWQFTKTFGTKYYKIKLSTFYKNVERVAYINTFRNINNIINDLNNNLDIEEIIEKYNITFISLKKVFSIYSKNGTYQEDTLKSINTVLESDVAKKFDLDILCAKAALKLFIDNNVYNEYDADKKGYTTTKDYLYYLHLLKDKKHPLYYQYNDFVSNYKSQIHRDNFRKRNDEKIRKQRIENDISNCSTTELVTILNDKSSLKYRYLVDKFNLNNIIFTSILKMNKDLINELANNINNIEYIYNNYVSMYIQVAEEVIKDIKLLSKDKFKEPLDLYKYYSNNYNLLYIAKIAKELPDLKNSTLILRYIEKFPSLFVYLDEKSINNIKIRGHLFCLSENISFTNRDLKNALKDIEDKGMPLLKGVLYGSIKRQVDIKNNKVKKKTLC